MIIRQPVKRREFLLDNTMMRFITDTYHKYCTASIKTLVVAIEITPLSGPVLKCQQLGSYVVGRKTRWQETETDLKKVTRKLSTYSYLKSPGISNILSSLLLQ